MANCGGGTYDWGSNMYCPRWNPQGVGEYPGAGVQYIILDAGTRVEVKAFKWAASGESFRKHGTMRVYRSDDESSWTQVTDVDVDVFFTRMRFGTVMRMIVIRSMVLSKGFAPAAGPP